MKVPKWAIGVGVGVLLVVVLIASMLGPSSSGGTPVEAEAAKKREIVSRVKAAGEITPDRRVEISAKVIGEIIELPVQEGDTVKAGDVLVQIEKALYEASRNEATAALRQTEVSVKRLNVQLAAANRGLVRAMGLHASGFASTEQVETAQAEVDTLKVELEAQAHAVSRARSTVRRMNDDLARTTILSPMDGTVIQLNQELGETVIAGATSMPGSVIMIVADMSRLLVAADVTEVDVVNVKLGQKAEIHVDALGDEVQDGEVVFVGTSGRKDPSLGVIRFQVKVAIHNPHAALRPPMTAKVNILTAARQDAVSVPIQAVVKRRIDEDGKEVGDDEDVKATEVVYVIRKGKARAQVVTTGSADVLHVEVTEGLEAGDVVVTGPYRTLKKLSDGDAVSAKEKKSDEPDEPSDEGRDAKDDGES